MIDKNDTRREFEAWFPLDQFGKNALHYSVGNYTFEPAATYCWVWQVATERATAIERERCAVVVEAMTERKRMNSSQKPDCEYAAAIRKGNAK